MRPTTHRRDHGRYYRDLEVHAAPGVHEHVVRICQAALKPGARILEVGAGSGALALRLRDNGFEVMATDMEPNQPWIHALDLDKPQVDKSLMGSWDMIVCVETMEHLENPRAALRTMRGLLEQGGKLLLSTPNVTHPHSRLRTLFKGVPSLFGPTAYYDTGHITLLPDWLLVEHLRSSGFEDIFIERAGDVGISARTRRFAHRVEMTLLRVVGVKQVFHSGDGVCLLVVASAV